MQTTTKNAVADDVKTLANDASKLLNDAKAETAVKASELRAKGLTMLDNAWSTAHDMQAAAIERSKQVAAATDDYVHQNPWRAVTISAGIGLLIGFLFTRK